MSKNLKNLKFTVKLLRPHCRTPIKPMQTHKNDAKYSRKVKNERKNAFFDV